MASALDSWMREYNEASKLADDISNMISFRGYSPFLSSELNRHMSEIRWKMTILGTRLDSLESLLLKLPGKQPITEKELHMRQDMLTNLRSKAKQMASAPNMSKFANRGDLLGPSGKPSNEIDRVAGMDNRGIVGLQRQVMKEQDESLEKLEETVVSTKHIALAVNEELGLHTRLVDSLDDHVDLTDSRLRVFSSAPLLPNMNLRVQKRLAILTKRKRGGCSCMSLLLAVITIVILAVVIWLLVKYL